MKYLIIGGTGTLGREMVSRLVGEKDSEVTVFSRDELKQKEMKSEFPTVKFVIGDVRDYQSVEKRSRNIDAIFHFAALKHVDICEENPDEAIRTNLIGTMNVAEAAIKNGVHFCALSSTDKAVDPINTYGHTKALAEKVFFNRNKSQGWTVFNVYRWGNVIGSRGSVIQQFARDLIENKKVFVTHRDMSRFWLKIEDAVSFMLETYQMQGHHHAFIPPLKGCSLLRMIEAISELVGVDKYKIHNIGIRPGEKLHEVLRGQHEDGGGLWSNECEQYTDDELTELLEDYLFKSAPDLLKNQELQVESSEVSH